MERSTHPFSVLTVVGLLIGLLAACESQTAEPLAAQDAHGILSFSLIDASTEKVIASFDPIQEGVTIPLDSLPSRRLNIRANTTNTTKRVRFDLNNKTNFRTERSAPFALAGDKSGNYYNWSYAKTDYTLRATAYADREGTQQLGQPLTVTFSIAETAPTEDPPTEDPPTEDPPAPPPPTAGEASPRLVKDYYYIYKNGSLPQRHVGDPDPSARGGWMTYYPNGFSAGLDIGAKDGGSYRLVDAASFANWDLLFMRQYKTFTQYTMDEWIHLTLNRRSTVGVIWHSTRSLPSWLKGWTPSGQVTFKGPNGDNKVNTVYTKVLPAGEQWLGSMEGRTDRLYTVILAEADGSASPPPDVPAGREKPVARETCPTWVHDQYTTTGPDGKSYRTWHPQIDPVYWCYFRHEHGSDPSWLGDKAMPAFGYSGSKMGHNEPHPGFKVISFKGDNNTGWAITHHFGTSGAGRLCARHHTLDIMAVNLGTGETLVDYHQMGDFGLVRAVDKYLNNRIPNPSACPGFNESLVGESHGRRLLRVYPATGYEAWSSDMGDLLHANNIIISVNDTITACKDSATCDELVTFPGRTGSQMWFRFPDDGAVFKVDGRVKPNGVFYTDPTGNETRAAGAPDAIRQYLKPGALYRATSGPNTSGGSTKHYPQDPWVRRYVSESQSGYPFHQPLMNIDEALKPPN